MLIRWTATLLLGITMYALAAVDYNNIAAVTSASGRFKIIGGKAFATSAQVTWWDFYNNGTQHVLKYGTSTAYGQQINLKPFTAQTNITTTIPNLLPGTKYYIQFYRPWQGRDYMTNDTFTTFRGTEVVPSNPKAAPAINLQGKTVEVYLPSGRLVVSRTISQSDAALRLDDASIGMRLGLKNGIYLFIVRERDHGAVLARLTRTVLGT